MRVAAHRCAFAAALLAAALPTARAAVEAVDDAGVTVTLAAPAVRIVSLAPHATELLYAAGAGDRVVGVLATSDWPPEALRKPRVGDSRALDLERILVLAPDLVVTWPVRGAGAGRGARRARRAGLRRESRDDRRHRAGSRAAGNPRRHVADGGARRPPCSARNWRGSRIAIVERRTVRVFYEIWNVPLYTIGGHHLISQALSVCGGENVFASLSLPAPGVSVEAVLAAKPDAIIAGADRAVRPAWLDEWKRWPTLPAVARGNLFTVDANLLHRSGPRFIDGVEAPCATLARRARRALNDQCATAAEAHVRPARGAAKPHVSVGPFILDRQERLRRAVAHADEPVSEQRR